MVTHFQSGRTSALLRAFTRLMAFVCLWMGTVSVAHHTDEINIVCASHIGQTTLHTQTPQTPETPCAACEWLLSLMPRISANAHVALSPAARIAFAVPAVRFFLPRAVCGVRLRGPPSSLDVFTLC